MKQKPQNENPPPQAARRGFLTKIWFALGLVALGEFVAVVLGFFKPGKSTQPLGSEDATISCGPVERFLPGTVTAFVQGRFYLARLDDGGFLAISRQCTHLGCTVPWVEKEKRFVCPCHGSVFDITGSVVHPPAPRALNLFSVAVENDAIKVNTAASVKRSDFSIEQVTYAQKT